MIAKFPLVILLESWCLILSYIPFDTCHLRILLPWCCFKNIKYCSALFFSWCNMSCLLISNSICHLCNWFNSFSSASFPLSPNLFMPYLTFIWVMIMYAWGLGSFFVVDSWPFYNLLSLVLLLVDLGLRLYLCLLGVCGDSGWSSVSSFSIYWSVFICSVFIFQWC